MKRKSLLVGLIAVVAAAIVTATALAISGGDLPANQTAGQFAIPGLEGGDPGTTSIDVKSWSWGVSNTGDAGGGGGGAGRADLRELSIVKTIDKASPALALKCATGQHLPQVVLTVDRPGGSHAPFLEIKLEDALITSVQPGGSDNDLPLEQVSFAYRSIQLKYTTVANEVVQANIDNR